MQFLNDFIYYKKNAIQTYLTFKNGFLTAILSLRPFLIKLQ